MSWGSRDQGPQTRDQKKQVCRPPGWRPEIQIQGVSRAAGKYLPCRFQLLVALAAPHLWPHPSSLCLCQLWASPLSVSDKFLSSYKKPGTLHRGPRGSNTTSSLFVAARLFFQGRSPSQIWVDVYFGATFHPSLMDQWERKCLPMQERRV